MNAPPAQPRGCLATLAVLAAMVAIVLLGGLGAAAVADRPDLPVTVSRGVSVQLPSGWEFAGRTEDGSGVLLTSGAASVFLSTVEGTDELGALRELKQEWSSEPLLMTGEIERTNVRPGVPAARFAYTGSVADVASAIEGEVTALRGSGYVAIFDGWAGLGNYLLVREEIEQMIVTAVLP